MRNYKDSKKTFCSLKIKRILSKGCVVKKLPLLLYLRKKNLNVYISMVFNIHKSKILICIIKDKILI